MKKLSLLICLSLVLNLPVLTSCSGVKIRIKEEITIKKDNGNHKGHDKDKNKKPHPGKGRGNGRNK
jgi:hypothetical protein